MEMEVTSTEILSSIESARVQLIKLAFKLGVAPEAIASILRDAGYKVGRKLSRFYLDENQLQIVKAAYIDSVHDLFSRFKKNHQKFSKNKSEIHFRFFRQFIGEDNLENISEVNLDSGKIEDFFLSLVNSTHFFFFVRNSKKAIIRLKLRIVKTFNEIRRMIIATFIKYHFYNFSIDEESSGSKRICFS